MKLKDNIQILEHYKIYQDVLTKYIENVKNDYYRTKMHKTGDNYGNLWKINKNTENYNDFKKNFQILIIFTRCLKTQD